MYEESTRDREPTRNRELTSDERLEKNLAAAVEKNLATVEANRWRAFRFMSIFVLFMYTCILAIVTTAALGFIVIDKELLSEIKALLLVLSPIPIAYTTTGGVTGIVRNNRKQRE